MRYPLTIGAAAVALAAAVAFWEVRFATPEADDRRVFIDAGNPEYVELGRLVYGEQCSACHGDNLEGQSDWRVRKADGRLPAPPHDASGHTWHHVDDVLFKLTKYGPAALVGGDYESDMPAYDGVLSDREILAALAFIKSTWPIDVRTRHDAMNAAMHRQAR